ncbi:MAG: NADH-quinone oxidoreductase subunit D [Planctomycetes bacterium]|jgi:NADH-quinone oxidoreductase subunit D|nr:NADH-quinone oxidoreductase subunit D [Planctomycetota bacterium]MBT4029075.1 NADH-quinone oxidoreductase subunit D [Planctomycetota bacterium]MBT4560305.1 NADH-quinone oxidoreductase subunit D [Planctomycetota bacterium]MBT5101483.1 NADH-quinone oxidoreductase subunit D [Planctomycetota bacterium]MBT5119709.1 NADH-quinone oxidoreductase subunit D [Planctomycetota bacterium]
MNQKSALHNFHPAGDFASLPGQEVEFDISTKDVEINMGPQHPATHGVLRVLLKANGEILTGAQCHLGYLHRSAEKIGESVDYVQYLPYTDRYDYLASMNNNLSYALAVEKLMGVEAPERAQYLRTIVVELNRVASHLVAIGTYGIDLGAFTPFFYMIREREMLLDLFEKICGARLTYTYIRPGGVMNDAPPGWLDGVKEFTDIFDEKWCEYWDLLMENKIFIERTANVGVITPEQAIAWGTSGPVLRGSGVDWDVRKNNPYMLYEQFDFEAVKGCGYKGTLGDCYDRSFVRMYEMVESVKIVRQCLEGIQEGEVQHAEVGHALKPAPGEVYAGIENPRGELGHYIVSNGEKIANRMRVRSPSYCNLSIVEHMLPGCMLADAAAIIGSVDIVMGETDR